MSDLAKNPLAGVSPGREKPPRPPRRRVRGTGAGTIVARGEPMLWLTGAALVICFTMIVGLLCWIASQAVPAFWPEPVVRVTTIDGQSLMGEVFRVEEYPLDEQALGAMPVPLEEAARAALAASADGTIQRRLIRTGNYDLFETHFTGLPTFAVAEEDRPEAAVVVERMEWGRFYGFPELYVHLTPVLVEVPPSEWTAETARADALRIAAGLEPAAGAEVRIAVERGVDGRSVRAYVPPDALRADDRIHAVAEVWQGGAAAWTRFEASHDAIVAMRERAASLREHEIGEVNERLEEARLRRRASAIEHAVHPVWLSAYDELLAARRSGSDAAIDRAQRQLMTSEDDFGKPATAFLEVVAEVEAIERQAADEFAAINAEIEHIESEARRDVLHFATARAGVEKSIPLADIVRAYPANRLGFGEKLGVYLDRWKEFLTEDPREANNEGGVFPAIFGTVLMTLIMCLVVVPFGVLAALYLREYAKAGPVVAVVRIAVNNLAGVPSIVFGVFGLGFFCYIVGASIDELFYEARLPQPTFGKGGLIWASLTLALMTAPVVVVATEEALSAVPGSMREGSYACGASKWQTIQRIVLPRAMPGIMTGAILAMARGAGEVAPLMLVGAVKMAPELPFDTEPPFGINRSFMHLGFHIYDLGFQSQNSEAAKPLVYTTAFLLIGIVALLNVMAIKLRTRLRRRFMSSVF